MKAERMENIRRMWDKEGYTVYFLQRSGKNQYAFVQIRIIRKDGKPVEFENEWDLIKSLASRQGHHALPIREHAEDKSAFLRLISREMANDARTQAQFGLPKFNENYWVVQGDGNAVCASKALNDLFKHSYTLRANLRNSTSNPRDPGLLSTMKTEESFRKVAERYTSAYKYMEAVGGRAVEILDKDLSKVFEAYLKIFQAS